MEIKLDKPDDRPWGFRLTGGADCEEPLTVIKVSEGSLAELAGLRVGDVIVRVNDVSTSDLTHMQVHDVIQESGRALLFVVERRQEDLIEKETANTKTESEASVQREETISIITEKQSEAELETEYNSKVQQQNTIQKSTSPSPDTAMHERKWSTFLQKPKREKPKPKKTDKVEIKGEPYRVIIKKQKKKEKETPSNATAEETANNEEAVKETESDAEITSENNTDVVEIEGEITEPIDGGDKELQTTEEADENEQQQENPEEEEEASKSEAAMAIETVAKPLTLEEQLAQVQKQLQELAQLPSTIQSTLDAVTKKLATIVNAAQHEQQQQQEQEKQEHDEQEKTATENDISEEISLEETVNEEERGENEDAAQQDEMVDFEVYLPDVEPKREESKEEPALSSIMEENEAPEQESPSEEELEMERIEREKFEKLQKELKSGRSLEQKPDFPLTPLERPIILPGGRRWSQPDDACPAIRNPKMTDEKIADTIEMYSEVIAGQIKGLTTGTIFGRGPTRKSESTVFFRSKCLPTVKINFLKYQPPPKNLDYLQRSEVYRLVHDMEPPVKGIARRASKILAEQDYYSKVN